jgi:hypothetical protein
LNGFVKEIGVIFLIHDKKLYYMVKKLFYKNKKWWDILIDEVDKV